MAASSAAPATPYDTLMASEGKGAPPSAPPAAPAESSGYQEALTEARKMYEGKGFLTTMGSGMSLGFSSDIDSAVEGAIASANNLIAAAQGKHPKYTADEARRAVKFASEEALHRYSEKHPLGAIAADITGSLLTPGVGELNAFLKLKAIGPAWRAITIGGVLGGASAAGHTHGSLANRAQAAPMGALEGAAGGGILHGGGVLAGKLAQKGGDLATPLVQQVTKHFIPEGERVARREETGRRAGTAAVREIVDRRAGQGVDLHKSEAEAAGKDVTAAEHLGPHTTKKLGTIASVEGKTADTLVPKIEARQEEAGRRVATKIAEVAGLEPETIEGDFEKANETRRKRASPLFDAWHAQENVESPELKRVRDTAAFKDALKVAVRKASNEHENAVTLGLESGDVPLMGRNPTTGQPVPMNKPNGEPNLVSREAAFSHAKASGFVHPAEVESQPLPTAKGYDYAKRAMDDLINSDMGKDKVTGKLTAYGREIAQVRHELQAALTDETKPWGQYAKAAFAAGADPLEREEAFRAGKNLMSNTVSEGDFVKRISRFNPAQMEALKAGIANDARNLAQAGRLKLRDMLTPVSQAKLVRAFGAHNGLAIIDDLEHELQLSKWSKMLTPAPRIPGEGGSADIGTVVYHILYGAQHLIGNPALTAIHWLRAVGVNADRYLDTVEGRAANDRMGELLSMKPSELADALKREGAVPQDVGKLERVIGMIRASPALRSIIETGSARVAGRLAGETARRSSDQPEPDYDEAGGKEAGSQSGETPYDKLMKEEGDKSQTPPSEKQASPQPARDTAALTPANYEKPPGAFTPKEQVSGYLEHVLGFPVTITSGYRDPMHNAEVGGVEHSAHLLGEAWDFQPHGASMEEAGMKLAHSGIAFDQIEITPTHVHVSFDPRMRHDVIFVGFGGRGRVRPVAMAEHMPSRAGGSAQTPDASAAPAHPPAVSLSDPALAPAQGERPF